MEIPDAGRIPNLQVTVKTAEKYSSKYDNEQKGHIQCPILNLLLKCDQLLNMSLAFKRKSSQ